MPFHYKINKKENINNIIKRYSSHCINKTENTKQKIHHCQIPLHSFQEVEMNSELHEEAGRNLKRRCLSRGEQGAADTLSNYLHWSCKYPERLFTLDLSSFFTICIYLLIPPIPPYVLYTGSAYKMLRWRSINPRWRD